MLDLSPAKLLIIAIVAVILLGPDKLPQVARQAGAGWRKFRDFHQRVESEVRENIPDLPSTRDIARMARSPVALLNHFANTSEETDERLVEDPAAGAAAASNGVTDAAAAGAAAAWPADPGAAAGDALLASSTGTDSGNGASPNGASPNGASVNGASANSNGTGTENGHTGSLGEPGSHMAGQGGTSTEVPFDPSMN